MYQVGSPRENNKELKMNQRKYSYFRGRRRKNNNHNHNLKRLKTVAHRDFPVALMAKNLPSMQETQPARQETGAWSLGQKDSLEKEMATHSSILAWRIPWTEEPGGLQSMESQKVGHGLYLSGLLHSV